MKDNSSDRGHQSGGVFHWFFQRVTGAFLLIALLIHFWVLHFFPRSEHGELSYDIVMQRLSSPLWKTLDLMFLLFALYHAMNGMTMLINDYIHKPRLRMFVIGVLWVGALWLSVLGSITILSL